MNVQTGSSFFQRPHTREGWTGVVLASLFVAMFLIVTLALDFFLELSRWIYYTYVGGLALSGLAAGITGLIAVIRKRDFSWLVWLAILSGAVVFLSFH
jgi:hypothetical protein